MCEDSLASPPQRVLIATVGTGRKRSDIAQAIVFSVKKHEAEYAVFLCSEKTKQETLPEVLDLLGWDASRYGVDVCDDEENLESLFIAWNRLWDAWLAGRGASDVVVDFTSGTKPMSAAAALLAVSRGAKAVSYVTGDRDDTGRVSRSTGVRTITPSLVTAHRQLRLAVEHFHAGSYAAARDIAAAYRKLDNLRDDHLREVARSVHYIAKACEAWDRFDYKTAYAAMHDSRKFWKDWEWVDGSKRLEANAAIIREAREACGTRNFSSPLAADLVGNARRCMAREAWDDAVARLYRACELLAQIVLLRDFSQKTDDIDTSKLPAELREPYEQKRGRDGKIKLGLHDSYCLLEKLGHALGREFVSRYGVHPKWGDLHNRLEKRNQSLLAHGVTPIREEDAEALLKHVEALAETTDRSILNEWLPKTDPVRFRPF